MMLMLRRIILPSGSTRFFHQQSPKLSWRAATARILDRRHGGGNFPLRGMVARHLSRSQCFFSTKEPPPASKEEESTTKINEPRVETKITSDGICHVILNRPNKLNALDLAMFEAIAETASQLQHDRSLRAVILRGKGRAFCTGLDVKSVLKSPQKITERLLERPSGYGGSGGEADISNLAQDVSILWRELPVPVLAVLHGMCYGGGLQIALGADLRYATPDCQLSIMEGKWGLIPDMGITVTLRELVRIDIAKELTYTGRVLTGTEAERYGLVTHCYDDPLAHAEALAKELVQRSPDAIASTKRLYQQTWNTAKSEKEALLLETELQRPLLASWNQLAASGRAFGWTVPYFKRK